MKVIASGVRGLKVLTLLLISPVTLGKLFNFLLPQFLDYGTGMMIIVFIFYDDRMAT